MSHRALSPEQFSGYTDLLEHVEGEHGHQPWGALHPSGTVLKQEHDRLHEEPG
jgi:hypothetical protein